MHGYVLMPGVVSCNAAGEGEATVDTASMISAADSLWQAYEDASEAGNPDAVGDHGTATFTLTASDTDTAQTTLRLGYPIVVERMPDGWKISRAANTWLQAPSSSEGSGRE